MLHTIYIYIISLDIYYINNSIINLLCYTVIIYIVQRYTNLYRLFTINKTYYPLREHIVMFHFYIINYIVYTILQYDVNNHEQLKYNVL